MSNPPTYEESTLGCANRTDSKEGSKEDSKGLFRLSISEELGVSRSQRVAALVAELIPLITSRARDGLSKSTFALRPANSEAGSKDKLVGFPEDEVPTLIELEGQKDALAFWSQQEALDELHRQLRVAVTEGVPNPVREEATTPPSAVPPAAKASFFGRKQTKTQATSTERGPAKRSTNVEVALDEIHFRAENAFGLYETKRARCVLVNVDIR